MIFISDVHDSPSALRRLVDMGEEVAILGDLVNLTDYRTGEGAVATVMGHDFASETSRARGAGDYTRMRALWATDESLPEEVRRRQIAEELSLQYSRVARALEGGHGLVIHGNVDRLTTLKESLPTGFRYVHGEVVERDGTRIGFVGGGVRTPLNADGEVSHEEMASILESLGPLDVLCTHVAPAITPLRTDVVTGREERGSEPVRDYLEKYQPGLHLFGDVHQPQASMWRVGRTRCFNAGYFRATGRFLRFDGSGIQVGAIR